jgi:molybdenum cofactor cytidylyltransferase
VLAAGLSSRYGKPKQLATIGGKTLIQNAVDIANGSSSDYVYVVLGNKSSEIMKNLILGRAQVLLNKNYRSGLSSSLRTSIRNLPPDCTDAVLMVADQPFLLSKHIDRLISTSRRKKAPLASLALKGEPRNPALFSRPLFHTLMKVNGDKGAREVVREHRSKAALINIGDPLVFVDVDTVENLKEALRSKNKMEKSTKI